MKVREKLNEINYGRYTKNVKRIYKKILPYVEHRNGKDRDVLINAIVSDVPALEHADRIVMRHVVNESFRGQEVFRNQHAADAAIKLASLVETAEKPIDVGFGRIVDISVELFELVIIVSPLFNSSPAYTITFRGKLGEEVIALRRRSGIPVRMAKEITSNNVFLGTYVTYIIGKNGQLRLCNKVPNFLAQRNRKIVYSKIGRSTRGPFPCVFCKNVHQMPWQIGCRQIIEIGRDTAQSFRSYIEGV